MKKLYMSVIVLLLGSISVFAQAERTVTITEAQINEAIAARIAQLNRDISMTVDVQPNQVVVNSVISSEERSMGIMFETIYIGDVSNGRFSWMATNWEAMTTEGDELDRNEFPRHAFIATDDLWKVTFRQLVRRDIDATRSIMVSSLDVIEDSLSISFVASDERPSGTELSQNAASNDDGSVTVTIAEETLNTAFANIAARNDGVGYLIITMTNAKITFETEISNICSAGIIVDFDVLPPPSAITNDNPNRSIVVRDFNNDGLGDLGIFTTGIDKASPILTSVVALQSATCVGSALTAQQQERVNSLLLPAVQRLLQLQSCGVAIYDVRFEQGQLVLTLDESYTTCTCTHL